MKGHISLYIVDDDVAAAETVRKKLSLFPSCSITRFETVPLLTNQLPADFLDLILLCCDSHLPRTLEAVHAIRDVDATVPVIVSSPALSEEDSLALLAAGATDYLDPQGGRPLSVAVAAALRPRSAGEGGRQMLGACSVAAGERDVTLQSTCEFLRTVMEALPIGVRIVDADGSVTAVNGAAKMIWSGARSVESVSRLDYKAWAHETGKRIRSEDLSGYRALREGVTTIGEIIDVELSNGTRKTIVNSAIPIRDDEGNIMSAVLVSEDITELKRLEDQVIQAHKMDSVGLLAGGIAHDFNNLLTAINGYSQIIQENLPKGDDLLAMSVEQVLAAGRRASDLTQKLLAFSRKQPLTLTAVKVDDLIANTVSFLTRLVGEDITLATSPGASGVRVMADNAQLDQVIINLVMNARDALGPEGGTIHIGSQEETLTDGEARILGLNRGGAYAVITVTDNGKGMDEKTRKRIFEPFFTTKEKAKGTGLGLSIIYGIIRQHNGSITVDSTPGKGSTFTVYLPVSKTKGRKASPPQQLIPFGGAEKILLAEDDKIVREYLSTILSQCGYAVVTAADGAEAESRFKEHADDISLVITDVVMPEKNGREIHEEIKKLRPETKIIYISGYTADIINRKGIVDRNIDFLMKPVSRGDFLQKVREVLDRP